jgi:hypothetical protein
MSDRRIGYLVGFTARMATYQYGKVPIGHANGSWLGVNLDLWVFSHPVASNTDRLPAISSPGKFDRLEKCQKLS